MLADGLQVYQAEEFPDEWRFHHQRGLVGYTGWETLPLLRPRLTQVYVRQVKPGGGGCDDIRIR